MGGLRCGTGLLVHSSSYSGGWFPWAAMALLARALVGGHGDGCARYFELGGLPGFASAALRNGSQSVPPKVTIRRLRRHNPALIFVAAVAWQFADTLVYSGGDR